MSNENPHSAAHVAMMLYGMGATEGYIARSPDEPTMVYIDGVEICEIGNPRNRPPKDLEVHAGIGMVISAMGMELAQLDKQDEYADIYFSAPGGGMDVYAVCMEEFEDPDTPYMIINGKRVYNTSEMFG